jgi:CubicO group peptidase (beta-lactamase class C family)
MSPGLPSTSAPSLLTPTLAGGVALAEKQRTSALLVVCGEEVLVERYWLDWTPATPGGLTSASKTVVATLVGMCIQHGHIRDVRQPAADFIHEWRGDARAGISIEHLLSMTSGLRNLPLWRLSGRGARIGIELDLEHPPGCVWAYNTAAYRALFAVIERATDLPLPEFSRKVLFDPLGMEHAEWRTRRVAEKEEYSGLQCSARDAARVGQLLLQRGLWRGAALLPADYIARMFRPGSLHAGYGYLVWLNSGHPSLFPGAPPDTVAAMGAAHIRIFVIPSRQLVIVRMGEWGGLPGERLYGRLDRRYTFDNWLLTSICAECWEVDDFRVRWSTPQADPEESAAARTDALCGTQRDSDTTLFDRPR